MHFYLTYNDTPSGIYSSQVIDVVKFLNYEIKAPTKLVSLISIRGFFTNRKKIQSELPQAIVLPMFPGVHRWRFNMFLLQALIFIFKPKTIIGRSVIATQLALRVKKKTKSIKVVYDGRAAVKAEWNEYKVVTNQSLLNSVFELEKQCVLQSDYKIAVSNELVNYWKKEFNYDNSNHCIIPCTLNSLFENINITNETIFEKRKVIGFSKEDVIFVYSGSLAGWQSIHLMIDFIKTTLQKDKLNKMLFLSELTAEIKKLQIEFPNQVECKKVNPKEVPHFLIACDYGIIIREKSVTNQVASPVKFAEYLACGLDIIISESIGDYTEFVKQNNCGSNYMSFSNSEKIAMNKKINNQKLALHYFTKHNFKEQYLSLTL